MEEKFKKRIGYKGNLKDISLQLCKDYNLGEFVSNKIILMGYEDFNFVLETSNGKYFVKTFAKFRDLENCKRYIEIIEKAIEKGISTPKLLKSNQGHLYILTINDTELRLCVLDFIKGKTLFELKDKLNDDEVKFIASQASMINSINLKPTNVYDEWAIVNFNKEFKRKKTALSEEDLELIKPLVNKFNGLHIEKLPPCFVHGDIITTNVMKDSNNKLWIIDFAVSNYYPRIQEMAIIACNLLFNENNKKTLEIALKEYQKTTPLTKSELDTLPTYIKLAHAMHLLSANYEKVHKDNFSEENEYWLNQGKIGLK